MINGQGESINQMQKRPSTHKNMQTTSAIFDIDKGNSVRKTEELNINVNPNPEMLETNNNNGGGVNQNQTNAVGQQPQQ